MPNLDEQTILSINRAGWNEVASHFYGVNPLPEYGPLAETEDSLHLLGELSGKRVLEIGCGSGHSLAYLASQGASELWGLDLSTMQIEFATALSVERGFTARLMTSPMEENPGLPLDYFDLIVSIYALGWTANLSRTLALIYSYLKPGGTFVFSGEHSAYSCLEYENETYVFKRPYNQEQSVVHHSWKNAEVVITYRTLSTFINTAINAGFIIERLIESDFNPALVSEAHQSPDRWYSVERAKRCPTTFVLKVRKPER